MEARYAPAWFETEHYPPPRRVEAFVGTFTGLIGAMDVEVSRDAGFRGRLLHCRLPGAVLTTCFGAPARFARSDKGPDEGVLLLRPVGGAMTVRQNRRELVVEPRDAVLVSLASSFEYDATATTRVDHMRIAGPPALKGALPRAARASDNRLSLLTYYAGAVMQGLIPFRTERHARLAGNHLRELASTLFGLDEAENEPAPAARLAALKDEIGRGLTRRDLSVESLARSHGITARYVQKLFEAEGTTFTGYVLEQRLEAARTELLGGSGPRRSISAIAFDVGFGDLSYFNRAFRRRYGMSPQQARRSTCGES